MNELPENPSILAIDTATNLCAVALVRRDGVVEVQRDLPRAHNQHLLGMVSEVTDGRPLGSVVDAIACGVGPGSFTGIRVAVGAAKGLAWSLELPVIAVCSLRSQALYQSLESDKKVLSVIDAQIGQVYWAWFEIRSGGLVSLSAPTLSSPANITQADGRALNALNEAVAVRGDAAQQVADAHGALSCFECDTEARPRPAQSALEVIDAPETFHVLDASSLEPRYVQHDIGWKKLSEQGKRP